MGSDLTGSKTSDEPKSSQELARLASQLFGETAPLRQSLISGSEQFLEGDFDVTGTPQFGALKQATEQQFDVARERVIGSTPEGGALTQALTDVELGRAGVLTGGMGDIAQQQQGQALQLATGGTGQAFSGLGQSGAIQAAIAQANAQQNAQTKQGLGRIGATVATKGGSG